jgi:cation diffusion facilitator CzcD-associated flavoprotein CzcO
VVIGSGATAITLVPTMARETASLVMLQRSPTYIADIPLEDPTAMRLRKWLPVAWASRLTRWKKVLYQIYVYRLISQTPQSIAPLFAQRSA